MICSMVHMPSLTMQVVLVHDHLVVRHAPAVGEVRVYADGRQPVLNVEEHHRVVLVELLPGAPVVQVGAAVLLRRDHVRAVNPPRMRRCSLITRMNAASSIVLACFACFLAVSSFCAIDASLVTQVRPPNFGLQATLIGAVLRARARRVGCTGGSGRPGAGGWRSGRARRAPRRGGDRPARRRGGGAAPREFRGPAGAGRGASDGAGRRPLWGRRSEEGGERSKRRGTTTRSDAPPAFRRTNFCYQTHSPPFTAASSTGFAVVAGVVDDERDAASQVREASSRVVDGGSFSSV